MIIKDKETFLAGMKFATDIMERRLSQVFKSDDFFDYFGDQFVPDLLLYQAHPESATWADEKIEYENKF